MKTLFFASVLAVVVTGCAGQAQLVKALAKDPAIVTSKVVTPWGNGSFVRVGVSTNIMSVTVSPDGTVTIKPN